VSSDDEDDSSDDEDDDDGDGDGDGGGSADGLARAPQSASGAISTDELALRKRQSIERVAWLTAAINKMPRRMSDTAWALRQMGLASSGLTLRRLTAEDIDKLVASRALKHKDGYDVTAAAAKQGILVFPAEASALRECIALRDAAHEQVTANGYKKLQQELQEPAEPVTTPPIAPASVVPPVSTVGSRAQPGALGAPCEGPVRPPASVEAGESGGAGEEPAEPVTTPPVVPASVVPPVSTAAPPKRRRNRRKPGQEPGKPGRKKSTNRCQAIHATGDGKRCPNVANQGPLLCRTHVKQYRRNHKDMQHPANKVLFAEEKARREKKRKRK
jgi:hypothetical protein